MQKSPLCAEELVRDRVLARPAVAELVSAPGAAGDDLRDAPLIWGELLAEPLIVGERA